MKKRIVAWLLVMMLIISACPAMAAKATIKFPIQVGMLHVGDSVTLTPKLRNVRMRDLRWASSDPTVATMNGNRLTAVKEGIAIVGAWGKGATAFCGVVVLPNAIDLAVGDTYSLPANGYLQYASKDSNIATIDANGVVAGMSAGSTLVGIKFGKAIGTVIVNVYGGSAPSVETPAVTQSAAASLPCASETNKIVLVEYAGNAKATVSFHECINGVWTELGRTGGYVGLNGIDKTREGDKRTPTGTFNLTTPFGIADDPGAAQPYLKVTKYHYWCGSSGSEYYNQLVDTRIVSRMCTSDDEHLIDYGGYYDYGMFIDYNVSGTAGLGSCIFIHCMGGKASTNGCIAIPKDYMKTLIRWAGPNTKIVIR
ncbi:MAG: L,D-transpeptidase family protein [Clostridia bacterium]|nr:L,D-transpeptidase family protein [Clostridia bacterium]